MQCAKYEELVGKRLLHSVIDNRGMMLIPVDMTLTEIHVEKLQKFKIALYDIHVEWVENEQLGDTTEPNSIHIDRSTHHDDSELVTQMNALLQGIENVIKDTGKIPITEVETILLPTIMAATHSQNIYKLFADLKAEGDFRFKHSIGVAYIAALLGRSLKLDDKETNLLTIAASLCDIGTIQLPAALLHKTSELEPDEYEQMKRHTTMGHEMLTESGFDSRIALVALQHHEREDGSGYPGNLQGSEIHLFSKIIALADVYVAMTSERPQRVQMPFYQVINKLHEGIIQNHFDSKIGLTFVNLLMSAQIGSGVIMTNGKKGTIVLIHASDPARPLISLENQFIDLSKTNEIHIMEIVG